MAVTQPQDGVEWVWINEMLRRVHAAPNERKAWLIPSSHPGKTERLVRVRRQGLVGRSVDRCG